MLHPYQVSFRDARGYTERVEVIWALDDLMAMTTLRILAGENGAELWDGDRVVGKVTGAVTSKEMLSPPSP